MSLVALIVNDDLGALHQWFCVTREVASRALRRGCFFLVS